MTLNKAEGASGSKQFISRAYPRVSLFNNTIHTQHLFKSTYLQASTWTIKESVDKVEVAQFINLYVEHEKKIGQETPRSLLNLYITKFWAH